MTPSSQAKDFSEYVEHPHYGRGPRYTDLQVDPQADGVNLHWNTGGLAPIRKEMLERWPEYFASIEPA